MASLSGNLSSNVFSLTQQILLYTAEVLNHTYVVTQHIRAFEGCDMIKLIIFHLSSRAFSNVKLSFFNCEVCGSEEYDYLIPFGVPTLVCGKAPALPTMLLLSVQMSTL